MSSYGSHIIHATGKDGTSRQLRQRPSTVLQTKRRKAHVNCSSKITEWTKQEFLAKEHELRMEHAKEKHALEVTKRKMKMKFMREEHEAKLRVMEK